MWRMTGSSSRTTDTAVSARLGVCPICRPLTPVIPAQTFNTGMPDLTDEGGPAKTASYNTLTFKLAGYRSSRVLYRLFGNLSSTEDPRYESVLNASDEMEDIIDKLPPELRINAENHPSPDPAFSHLAVVRRFLGMTLAHRLYIIHRAYFIKSFRDRTYSKSHDACVSAAMDIIMLAEKGLPATFYRLWNTTTWLVAAGIVLSLDLLQASDAAQHVPDAPARRLTLTNLIDLLCNSGDTTGIASRGAALISALIRAEREIVSGQRSNIKFSRSDIMALVREPAKPAGGPSWGRTHSHPELSATYPSIGSGSLPSSSGPVEVVSPVVPMDGGLLSMSSLPDTHLIGNGTSAHPGQDDAWLVEPEGASDMFASDGNILSFLDELFPQPQAA